MRPRLRTGVKRAPAQVVAVEVQQVEGEISEPLGAALGERLGHGVEMSDASTGEGAEEDIPNPERRPKRRRRGAR